MDPDWDEEKRMDRPALTDKDQFPTEAIIFSHLGAARRLWIEFFAAIHADHADFSEEWRYYNDGKCWLMKATRKKKTIFWLAVLPGAFRITFYFTDKAQAAILASRIADDLKYQFASGNKMNKIRGLTIVFRDENQLADVQALIAIKLSQK